MKLELVRYWRDHTFQGKRWLYRTLDGGEVRLWQPDDISSFWVAVEKNGRHLSTIRRVEGELAALSQAIEVLSYNEGE